MGSAQTPLDLERGAGSRLGQLKKAKTKSSHTQSNNQRTKMSFLRRGNSSVTPDMEIRKRREVRRYFDKADKDGNGSLTKEEWYNVLNSSGFLQLRKRFKTSSVPWIEILTKSSLLPSSWGKNLTSRSSSRAWTRTMMDLSPKRSSMMSVKTSQRSRLSWLSSSLTQAETTV